VVRVSEHAGIDGLDQALIPDAEEINSLGQTYVDSYVITKIVDMSNRPVAGVRVTLIDLTLDRPVAGGVTRHDGTWTGKLVPARTVRVVPMRGNLRFNPASLIVTASMPAAVAQFTAVRA